ERDNESWVLASLATPCSDGTAHEALETEIPARGSDEAEEYEGDLGLLPLDLDAELLESVRVEGFAVLASARDQVAILRVSPDDPRALRDLRGCIEAIVGAADLVRAHLVAARASATLVTIDST